MSETGYFDIGPIRYEGPDTDNPLAFRHYDADAVIEGKTMRAGGERAVPYGLHEPPPDVMDGEDRAARSGQLEGDGRRGVERVRPVPEHRAHGRGRRVRVGRIVGVVRHAAVDGGWGVEDSVRAFISHTHKEPLWGSPGRVLGRSVSVTHGRAAIEGGVAVVAMRGRLGGVGRCG